MTSTLEIRAESQKIGAILKESFLRVPTNQRNYAWEGKHVRELFADLKEAIGQGAEEYFLGSIVLMGEQDKDNYVADGQQRLAQTYQPKAVPDDADFQHEFEGNDVKQGDIARYYLRSLERQQQNDPQAAHIPSDEAVITVEHLLPKDFAEYRGEWKHITDEMHEEFVWRLGNQMLLGEADNRAIGSRGYPFKKPFLEKSDFHFTALAGGYVSWGPEEIKDRQKQLAKLAPKVWPLTLRHKK